jgi:IclR family acetate operon transcriptional repressor
MAAEGTTIEPRSTERGTERSHTVTAIERAMDVMMLFAGSDSPTLGVTEIAQTLGLSKAVVHRVLSSFKAKGFVEVDPSLRRYRLGPNALYIGLAYLNRVDVRMLARPVIEDLSQATNETSTLSIRTGFNRVYIDQVTPERDVKMVVQLGRPVPLHAGASSKAFLAFLEPGEVEEYLSRPLEKLTPQTVTNPKTLQKELAQIRDRGYAESMEERLEGAGAVAAPVFGHEGRPEAVISVSGPVERFRSESERAARRLLKETKKVSQQLGFRK